MTHTRECLDSNRFGDGFSCICPTPEDDTRDARAYLEARGFTVTAPSEVPKLIMGVTERLDQVQRRAEAAEAEVERLRAAQVQASREAGEALAGAYEHAETLRAEVERLRATAAEYWKLADERVTSLAAANALLDDALEAINQDAWTVLADGIRAHLAAQPATAPTTLCTSHVAKEGVHPFQCAKCGKPFSEIAEAMTVGIDGDRLTFITGPGEHSEKEGGPDLYDSNSRQWIMHPAQKLAVQAFKKETDE
jgi:hypothetical protein